MNAKNPVNQRLAGAFNIPNDNSSAHQLILLERAFSSIEKEKAKEALQTLNQIKLSLLPAIAKAEVMELRGEAFLLQGLYPKARLSFEKALRSYTYVHELEGRLHCLQRLGDIERQHENFSRAQRWYENCIHIIRQLKDKKSPLRFSLTDANVGIALSLRGKGQFKKAEILLTHAVDSYRKSGDLTGQAFASWALGTTQRFLGCLIKGEINLRRSVGIYSKLGDEGGLAYALCGLGGLLRMQGRPQESHSCYKKANRFFKKLGDSFGRAYSFCGWGNALRMQNKFKGGLSFSRRAAEIYKKLNLKGPLGFVYWSMAQSEIFLENLSAAKKHLEDCRQLFETARDARGKCYYELGMGEYTRLFNPKISRIHYKKSLNSAGGLDIKLEQIHALRGLLDLSPLKSRGKEKKIWTAYKKIGVNIQGFSKYRTLP